MIFPVVCLQVGHLVGTLTWFGEKRFEGKPRRLAINLENYVHQYVKFGQKALLGLWSIWERTKSTGRALSFPYPEKTSHLARDSYEPLRLFHFSE